MVFLVCLGAEVAAAPSFDCNKASSRVENLICNDAKLAQLDSDLVDAYRTALRDAPWVSANRRIRNEQRDWMKQRNSCHNKRCLRHSYHTRIGALYAEVSDTGERAKSRQNSPERMVAICRNRAADVFHIRKPNVETKYKGQRKDGTHAVNGTAYLHKHTETFQCSFIAEGTSMVNFVVN